MALTAANFLAPAGRIEPHMFPGEGNGQDGGALQLRLERYVQDAKSQAGRDGIEDINRGATLLVYERAYLAIADRLNSLPSTYNQTDQGGHQYASDQRRYYAALAAEVRGEYETLTTTPVFISDSPVSRTVRNVFEW